MQFASSYERVTWIGLPKYASYDPTNAGVNIASNTLACFSARLGLLPQDAKIIQAGAVAVAPGQLLGIDRSLDRSPLMPLNHGLTAT